MGGNPPGVEGAQNLGGFNFWGGSPPQPGALKILYFHRANASADPNLFFSHLFPFMSGGKNFPQFFFPAKKLLNRAEKARKKKSNLFKDSLISHCRGMLPYP